MADITNVKLGICSVNYKGVDLGHTKGGVTVTYAPEYHEKTVDLYGNTPIDLNLLGERFSATVPLAESTLDNYEIAMPAGENDGDKITLGSRAGKALRALAGLLVLHPIQNGSDISEDVVMYLAISSDQTELGYNNDNERIMEVMFVALIDETKEDGNYLGMIGDSAA